jgi:formylglycine-generating enzyme required for sulfatase activity
MEFDFSRQARLLAFVLLLPLMTSLASCSSVPGPDMIVIPAGSIDIAEYRPVTLKSFELAKFDVTRGEFAAFARQTGFSASGCMTFNEAGDFENLPTANWENPGFTQSDELYPLAVG